MAPSSKIEGPSKLPARVLAFVFGLLLLIVLTSVADAREWRDRKGRVYYGILSGVVKGNVEIDSSGRIIKIPFSDLSAADQEYVRVEMAKLGINIDGGSPSTNRNSSGSTNRAGTAPPQSSSGSQSSEDDPFQSRLLENRMWEDHQGKRVSGRYAGMTNDGMVRLATGRSVLQVPFNNLSQEDQQFVTSLNQHYDPSTNGRIWTFENGSPVKAILLGVDGTSIKLMNSFEQGLRSYQAAEISISDLNFVAGQLDRVSPSPTFSARAQYRVWTAADKSWRMIARVRGWDGSELVVEQPGATAALKPSILSREDRAYLEQLSSLNQPDSAPEFSKDNSGGRGGETDDWVLGNFYSISPIFYFLLFISIMGLVAAVAFKHIRDSFDKDDDSL